jgi:RecA/RadA recombinase
MEEHAKKPTKQTPQYDGNEVFISTGSTLLDLAISGGRTQQGGIPGGILVELFGPSSAGKTVLLCEIAGGVKRQGGDIQFKDPEARLNKQFAKIFDLEVSEDQYSTPSTVPEVFSSVRNWEPKTEAPVHGIFADSLAALSTQWEKDDKDQYGMRRAKEFSEECRKTCRVLTEKGYLMVCSNQVRQNLDAGPYGQKYKSPGGEAIGFYSSLRLRCMTPKKITEKNQVAGKEVSRVIGVETQIEVFKSSVWKPYRTASIYILYDYGIDDIRGNLYFIKRFTKATTFKVNGLNAGKSIEDAIAFVEENDMEFSLKLETIDLWQEIEAKFKTQRKPKKRDM